MNKYIYILFILVLIFIIFSNSRENFSNETHFSVIVTTYNPGIHYLNKCLKSIENQNYKNYSLCILDDASNKDTKRLRDLIKLYCMKNEWEYVFRNENIGPLGGRIGAIEKLNPDDESVIISIDGDDELYNNNVFSLLNHYYKNNDIWITFGNYVDQYTDNKLSKPKIKCKGFNFKDITNENKFRETQWIYSHLKTFKYKLYKKISHLDLKKDNVYIKSATDMALMYPMLEMSNGKYMCINEILYKYNKAHPESHNVNKGKLTKQSSNAKFVKSLDKYNSSYFKDNNFKIVVTTYNPGLKYIKKCLESISGQEYQNYEVCVVDDCSTKDVSLIRNYIKNFCNKHKWKYIFNDNNLGMINSFINGVNILNCNDDDILVSIDGDDELYNSQVLKILNNKYDYNTLITFGNLISIDKNETNFSEFKCNRDWYHISKNKLFRDEDWYYTHLKTFRYKLFKKIKKEDLKIDGKYVKSATDRALMYPMLEMAGLKNKCISEPLYIYNRLHNESNNSNINKNIEQTENAEYFRKKQKYDTIF